MTYSEAVELVRQNGYNLEKIPAELVDLKLMRFARKNTSGMAVESFIPKSMKRHMPFVYLDYVVKYSFIDIDQDGWKAEVEPWAYDLWSK